MGENRLDQIASEPPTSFRLDDEDIGEIGEGRVVGDDPGETIWPPSR
jgi:hypothetical protein